jgi:hypothetical protein
MLEIIQALIDKRIVELGQILSKKHSDEIDEGFAALNLKATRLIEHTELLAEECRKNLRVIARNTKRLKRRLDRLERGF